MSTNHGHIQGCTGKMRYTSRAAAERVIVRMVGVPRRKNRAVSPGRLNAYQCGVCKAWHVGNSDRPAPLVTVVMGTSGKGAR